MIRTPSRRQHRSELHGFTLFEMLLVLVMMSLASMIAMVALRQSRQLLVNLQGTSANWTARHSLAVDVRREARLADRFELNAADSLVVHQGDTFVSYKIKDETVIRVSEKRQELFPIGGTATWILSPDGRRVQLKAERYGIVAMLRGPIP